MYHDLISTNARATNKIKYTYNNIQVYTSYFKFAMKKRKHLVKKLLKYREVKDKNVIYLNT